MTRENLVSIFVNDAAAPTAAPTTIADGVEIERPGLYNAHIWIRIIGTVTATVKYWAYKPATLGEDGWYVFETNTNITRSSAYNARIPLGATRIAANISAYAGTGTISAEVIVSRISRPVFE